MTKLLLASEAAFEQAFSAISLATWNRQRTDRELQSFLSRREAATVDIEL